MTAPRILTDEATVSVYDGREFVGIIVDRRDGCERPDAGLRCLGRFKDWREASTAIHEARRAGGAAMTLDLVAFGDDLDDDSPAAVCVRTALRHRPTRAEALFIDPDEGGIPDGAAIAWLTEQGVPMRSITSPWAIAAAHVRFDGSGRYAPHHLGDLAFILPVIDRKGAADLCAWIPRTGTMATRLGVGTMLGGDLIGRSTGDGVTIPPLQAFLSPLDWLRARRQGIVILDPARAAIALAGVVIEAVDNNHAAELRRALRAPAPIVRVRHLERLAA